MGIRISVGLRGRIQVGGCAVMGVKVTEGIIRHGSHEELFLLFQFRISRMKDADAERWEGIKRRRAGFVKGWENEGSVTVTFP